MLSFAGTYRNYLSIFSSLFLETEWVPELFMYFPKCQHIAIKTMPLQEESIAKKWKLNNDIFLVEMPA